MYCFIIHSQVHTKKVKKLELKVGVVIMEHYKKAIFIYCFRNIFSVLMITLFFFSFMVLIVGRALDKEKVRLIPNINEGEVRAFSLQCQLFQTFFS